MKLHEYIKTILVFFNSKFFLENNEVKANGLSTLINQYDKLIERMFVLDAAVPKLAALLKSEFHLFILQIKKNINLFEGNDKRLIKGLISLLQYVRTHDIKTLLNSDVNDIRNINTIFTEKRVFAIHFPKGKRNKTTTPIKPVMVKKDESVKTDTL